MNKWMAGFFDGEGSISSKYVKHPTKKTIIGVYVQVSNKYREPLNVFKKRFKGSIYINIQSGRPFFKWTLAGRARVEDFLRTVGIYCIVKKKQVSLAWKVCSIQKKRGIGKRKGYSGNDLKRLLQLKEEIIKTNGRYKAP